MSALPDPKVLRLHGVEHAYRPLHLRAVIAKHGISVAQLAARVRLANGRAISRTALTFVLNFDYWPRRAPRKSIVDQVEAYLASLGVPGADLTGAWAVDDQGRREHGQRYAHGADAGWRARWTDKDTTLHTPEKTMLSPAARKHFMVFRDPFNDEIRGPEDLYLAADQRYIREAMYTTARNGGFVAVVGESGAGKTTLRLDLIERIQKEGLQVQFIQPKTIDKKRITARLICEAILADLAPSETPPLSHERLTRKVERVLTESYKAGNRHVLMIEEAQDLEPLALKHLKRFYELQAGYVKLLSIILIGQPELKNLLNERYHFELREVIRRCEVAELPPLDGNVKDYLALKFERAGKKLDEIFTADAFGAIVSRLTREHSTRSGQESMVYPLAVNNVTTKAMNLAAAMGEKLVSAELVKEI